VGIAKEELPVPEVLPVVPPKDAGHAVDIGALRHGLVDWCFATEKTT
jgi:hypothetical protein